MSKTVALKTPEASGEEAPMKKRVVAMMNSCTPLEQSNLSHRIICREAVKADVKSSDFYSIVQQRLRSFDTVLVVTQTHVFQVMILYSEVGAPVRVALMFEAELPIVDVREQDKVPEGFSIPYDPATQTYQAVRNSDNHPHTAQHSRYIDALFELKNHAIFRGKTA